MTPTIIASNLCHSFASQTRILNNINLNVREGSIYGFLGPNGAGKTTTLQLLLGLIRKQEGEIQIFGLPFEQNRRAILRGVGSLIESPSLYGQLTASENLLVWQKIYQCPKNRITEVLNLVGLGNTGSKKASQFSLGMKQRLAIATALLHDPKLLILDEPTNGLDPNGIVEMRELLKTLNRERGITVLISSHLLAEIERLVTDVGIIHQGTMQFEGSLETLIQRQEQAAKVLFKVNDAAKAAAVFQENNIVAQVQNGQVQLPFLTPPIIAKLNRQLVERGVDVFEISKQHDDLEAIFMQMTHN